MSGTLARSHLPDGADDLREHDLLLVDHPLDHELRVRVLDWQVQGTWAVSDTRAIEGKGTGLASSG